MARKVQENNNRKARNRIEDPSVKKPRNGEVPDEDAPVMIYYKWCKGCGICVEFCPKQVLDFDADEQKPVVARPEDCIQCGICELRCPDFAITRVRNGSGNGNEKQKPKATGRNAKEK